MDLKLSPLDTVIDTFRNGGMVILVDDADRENEGDLVIAAEKVTEKAVATMMKDARGLICVSITEDLAIRLNLPRQTEDNRSRFGTQFTVTIDHKKVSGRGASADARVKTIRSLVADDSEATDFVSPGEVVPVVAHVDGVNSRRGQTEGSVELARLAGLKPSAVICEILAEDGSILRGAGLVEYANSRKLPITSVAALVQSNS